jgi:hypothetical protein
MDDIKIGTLPPNTTVKAASLNTGKHLLTTVDDFVANQSRFDRQARVNLQYSVVVVTREIYLDYVASQVMQWSDNEIDSLKQIITSMSTKFGRLNMNLPDTVYVVKTSGLEEGYAAYTRQENVIALPANMVASLQTATNYGDPLHPTQSLTYLENVIIHECFHLFSKNNPVRREKLYSLVHYTPTGNIVELPEVPWPDACSESTMQEFKITNPDTPVMNTYIEMYVKEDPDSGDANAPIIKRPLLPILVASGPYAGGIFFDYLQWYFMAIEQDSSGNWKPIIAPNSKPVVYLMNPRENPRLWEQYLDLVGYNVSGELFHPDEVLAQNFVFVANQPSMELLTEMGCILREDLVKS